MRRFFTPGLFGVLLLTSGACAQMPPLKSDAKVDDVLDALHSSGHNIHSFSADIKRQEFNDATGAEVDRAGKVWFKNQPDGDVIFHVVFDQKIIGKHIGKEKVEYQIEGGWLTALDYTSKRANRNQISPPGRKVNLFQLGEGQFPLPIGQDKKDVHALFDVSKVEPDKDDPANTIHLKLVPKPNTHFAEGFSAIEVWVDLNSQMPVRIATTNARKTEDTVNDLLNMKINPELTKEDLSVPVWDKTWKYTETPLPEQ